MWYFALSTLYLAIWLLEPFDMVGGSQGLNWGPKAQLRFGLGLSFVSINSWCNHTISTTISFLIAWNNCSNNLQKQIIIVKVYYVYIKPFCMPSHIMAQMLNQALDAWWLDDWYNYISYLHLQSSTPTQTLAEL